MKNKRNLIISESLNKNLAKFKEFKLPKDFKKPTIFFIKKLIIK
jgi:hypothetical protein